MWPGCKGASPVAMEDEDDDLTHLSGAHRRVHDEDVDASIEQGTAEAEAQDGEQQASNAPQVFGIGIQFKLHPSGLLCVNSIKEGGASHGKGILMGDVIAQVGGIDVLQQPFEIVSSLIKGSENSVVSISFLRASEENLEIGNLSREALLSGTRYYVKLRRSEPVGAPTPRAPPAPPIDEHERVALHARDAVSAAQRARFVAAASPMVAHEPPEPPSTSGAHGRPGPEAQRSMPASFGSVARMSVGNDARRAVSEALARQKVAYGARGGVPGWQGALPGRESRQGPLPVSAAERAEMANEASRREAKLRQRSRALHAKYSPEQGPGDAAAPAPALGSAQSQQLSPRSQTTEGGGSFFAAASVAAVRPPVSRMSLAACCGQRPRASVWRGPVRLLGLVWLRPVNRACDSFVDDGRNLCPPRAQTLSARDMEELDRARHVERLVVSRRARPQGAVKGYGEHESWLKEVEERRLSARERPPTLRGRLPVRDAPQPDGAQRAIAGRMRAKTGLVGECMDILSSCRGICAQVCVPPSVFVHKAGARVRTDSAAAGRSPEPQALVRRRWEVLMGGSGREQAATAVPGFA